MKKMDVVRNFLSQGEHDFTAIKAGTGIDAPILSVYLNYLQKRGEISKTGTRGSYRYRGNPGSGGKAEVSQSEGDNDAGGEGRAGGGGVEGEAVSGEAA